MVHQNCGTFSDFQNAHAPFIFPPGARLQIEAMFSCAKVPTKTPEPKNFPLLAVLAGDKCLESQQADRDDLDRNSMS